MIWLPLIIGIISVAIIVAAVAWALIWAYEPDEPDYLEQHYEDEER